MYFPTGTGSDLLQVAIAQFNSRDDKERNIRTALEMIHRAAATGARLVVLPEVWTYLGESEGIGPAAEPVPGSLTDLLAECARRYGIYLHAGSFYEREAGEPKVFNTTVVFAPDGEIIAQYRKIHLFDVVLDGVASYQESASVKAGEEIVTFDLDGITIGLAICYDLRFPELFRILALRGAEVILLPATFTMTTGQDHWELLVRARAVENGVFMVAANQEGHDATGKWVYGRSMIVDPWGVTLAVAPDTDTVISATLDRSQLRKVRRQIPSLQNRMPERYVWPRAESVVR